ncbi:putative quinol monooxygenase [Luteolibacter sp. AS25]|uniref:putative quinol monooxygenase n=1 Tax=Luteolibacter sp. AS25 TaxID=3135776 RepID=UPI00398ACDC0
MTNSSLFIIAKIPLKPEHYTSGKEAIIGILPETRAEIGCLQFELHEEAGENTLFLYEEWVDQAALDLHYQQEYTKAVFANYTA